jgi:hypothetical protein
MLARAQAALLRAPPRRKLNYHCARDYTEAVKTTEVSVLPVDASYYDYAYVGAH